MNLKDKVYEIVKSRIIAGEYMPGQQINEKEIIEELHISRTPFREAMNALSKEFLVNLIPNKGFFVRECSEKDILDIFDARYMLEPDIMRLICGKVSDETLAFLHTEAEQAIASKDVQRIRRADAGFHRMLIKELRNQYLVNIMENIFENDQIRVRHDHSMNNVCDALREHLKILQCLEERDADGAAEAMVEHLRLGRMRAMDTIF